MEEDRLATNLGPELPEALEEQLEAVVKTPKRRFIGRRAAAEKAASKAAANENSSSIEEVNVLQAPRPVRGPRSQVPASILEDEGLNAAIAHLPSNYNFEIHKTVHRIRSSEAKYIALQFPEGLLLFAPLISDVLTQFCPGTDTLIMGDVTYGACCVDDYSARALGCDLLVHYGHSCLVPVDNTQGLKTLYVFVTIGIDTDHLIKTIERNFQPGKRIALVGTIQFNATLHAILPRLRSSGYECLLPRSAPLSAGEILGCTAPSLKSKSTSISSSADPAATDVDMLLYVGDGRFHLESIMIASPSLGQHTYRYDPYSRRLTHETYEHAEMHSLRHAAISTAQKTLSPRPSIDSASTSLQPQTWGIILGTLGRQGNPHTLSLITAHLAARGITCVTLLLSEVFPAKLALMSKDVAVWVQIACPRLSIDWGYAFERPLLSPYEALVALGVKDGSSWLSDSGTSVNTGDNKSRTVEQRDIGIYPMDFYEKSGLGRTRKEDANISLNTNYGKPVPAS